MSGYYSGAVDVILSTCSASVLVNALTRQNSKTAIRGLFIEACIIPHAYYSRAVGLILL